MAEHTRWRIYPLGPLGSLVRAVSSLLASVPLIAMLMILPFLAARYVADKGAFGVNGTGLTWAAWAELALGIATLCFAFGTFAVSLLNLVRTLLTIGGLRRAIRHGGSGSEVPHPEQWTMATGWGGGGLIISSLLTTAVLVFPGILTTPVRTWVETVLPTQEWRLAGIPVAAIGLVGIFRSRRKRALKTLEGRWPETARDAAVAAARARVPRPPTNAAGDPKNPSETQRRPLDALGDRVNTAALVITGIALLGAAITLPVGTELIGYGFASSPVEALVLLSSPLLIAIAIVLYVLGGLLQNTAQAAELQSLLAAAQRPDPSAPELGVISRHWQPMSAPWVDFVSLVGALVLVVALPALLLTGSAGAESWGGIGVVVAVALLVGAAVLDVVAEGRTRDRRNLVLRRWPTPNPAKLTDVDSRVDEAVQADVERYGQRRAARPPAPLTGFPRGVPDGPPPAGPYPPPTGSAYPPPTGGPYPPPPEQPPAPAVPPPPAPARQQGARPAWGLPKKLRGRGLGDLYH